MPPQKKQRKHIKLISSIGVANRKIKKKYNKDLSKGQVIEILKSMSANELQEIVHEIISNKSQEIACETSSDEIQETIHETNFNESQEIINDLSLNESQEIACEISSDECQETIHKISFNEPQEIHEINTLMPQNKIEKKRNELIEHVKNLPENQIINAYTLFSTMRYAKGNHCGEIYSSIFKKRQKSL
jgi:Mg/Co/Ni transporter MgtE